MFCENNMYPPMNMPIREPLPMGLEYAQAYVPYQKYTTSYNPEEALEKGTMFPELYRPYEKYKRCGR